MANSLETILRNGPNLTANTTPATMGGVLPYGAGSYNLAFPKTTPAPYIIPPIFQGFGQNVVNSNNAFNKTTTATPAPIFSGSSQASPQVAPPVDLYAKYRDPKTGNIMSPEEYALYLGSKVPAQRGNGDIPQYAGDAMTNPDESSADLIARATNLNNARNDIATGTTDPYDITQGGEIVYSPQQLEAIEKAYAGIYDPALNDVFARLKTREEEAKRKQDREDMIFATDENIRQWRATTGTKSDEDEDGDKKLFTQTQLNDGASRANMSIADFETLDTDIKNYFINPPKIYDDVEQKEKTIDETLELIISEYKNGGTKEAAITTITNIGLTPAVTAYLIGKLPMLTKEEKDGWIKKTLGWFDSKINIFD